MDKEKRMNAAKEFAERMLKKYGPAIKSVVVFGSTARGDFNERSDIDIFIVYDDLFLKKYKVSPQELDSDAKKIGKDVNELIRVSTPWSIMEFIRAVQIGSPMLINILRDGWALYDSGIFINMKNQFEMGNIRWTFELINRMLISSRENFKNFERSKIKIVVEDIYYGIINLIIPILHLSGIEIISFSEIKDHMKFVKELANLDDGETAILEKIINMRDDFEHGKLGKISNMEFYEVAESSQKIREKLQKCEESLYEKAVEKRKSELMKKVEELNLGDDIAKSVKNSKSWAELDRLEARIYLIGNK